MLIGFACSNVMTLTATNIVLSTALIEYRNATVTFWIFPNISALVPHILVSSTSAVRHSLVVYAGTVNLLILLVLCDGNV